MTKFWPMISATWYFWDVTLKSSPSGNVNLKAGALVITLGSLEYTLKLESAHKYRGVRSYTENHRPVTPATECLFLDSFYVGQKS